jgi:hypothetical protein
MRQLLVAGALAFLLLGCMNGGYGPGDGTPAARSTGINDQADQFEDAMGFPLPGWAYMKYPSPR